jgi:hypothetical protein
MDELAERVARILAVLPEPAASVLLRGVAMFEAACVVVEAVDAGDLDPADAHHELGRLLGGFVALGDQTMAALDEKIEARRRRWEGGG